MKLNELKREGEMMKQMAIADAEAAAPEARGDGA